MSLDDRCSKQQNPEDCVKCLSLLEELILCKDLLEEDRAEILRIKKHFEENKFFTEGNIVALRDFARSYLLV